MYPNNPLNKRANPLFFRFVASCDVLPNAKSKQNNAVAHAQDTSAAAHFHLQEVQDEEGA